MATQSTPSPTSNRFAWTFAAALLLAAPGYASGPVGGPSGSSDGSYTEQEGAPIADARASYSFLRTLEGSATAAASGEGVGEPLEPNQPLLTGDLVRVGASSRLEIALSDRNRLYLDAETGVVLERLAFSGDREERVTVLRLEGGELLLDVSDEALGDELPRVITANATVYIQQPGEYRVESGRENDGQAWTRVVTRRGYAEIVTDRGSSVVREDEAMLAIGDRSPRLELAAADAADELERWGAELAGRALAGSRSAAYVEPHLARDAAPLDQAGDWVEYESVRYWRPYVSSGWRPYWQGRWDWTPSGYTWVSYEPWGWVPYHYGRWCSLPGYGWAWRPGAVYSPAWVYWNWTSGWAGWVPMGYYNQFYDPWYGGGYRYGVYGWAGGGWGLYSNWNYAPVHCFRDRRFRGHMRTGRDRERESGLREPPRGLLTTDTRDFRPDRIDRTEDLLHEIGKRNRVRSGQELPDVTDFVGRKGRLPTDVAKVIVGDGRNDTKGGPGGKGGKDSGLIRDIGSEPKIAEIPSWKKREEPKSGGPDPKMDRPLERPTGQKEPPVQSAGKGRQGGGSSAGSVASDKPYVAMPKGVPPAGAPVYGDKGGNSKTVSGGTRTPVDSGKGSAGDAENRQQWKDKGGGSEPVQKVVGSVRRPAPGGESSSPAYQDPKAGPRYPAAQPSQPSRDSGKGTAGYQDPQGYGKGSSGSQGSQGSPGYGKGSSGSQGSQGSPGYGKGSSGSQGSQGSSSGGRGSSASRGSQGSQPSGKSSSSSTGSKSSSSPPPPPPPEKKDGGGH